MAKNKRIIVITGNGKGKTTSAIGIIIRSLGYKKKVAIVKFFKAQTSGEDEILKKLSVKVYNFGQKQFFNPKKIPQALKKKIEAGWKMAQKLGNQVGGLDLLILDEINLALAGNLIPKTDVKNFIDESLAHLVFTGRLAPRWLKNLADTVSEIKEIKHIHEKGIDAQKGIEY